MILFKFLLISDNRCSLKIYLFKDISLRRIVVSAAVTNRTISAYNNWVLFIGKQAINKSKADLCTKMLGS